MKLLAIDTSGDACSAALLLDGEIVQHAELAPRRHGELILPMMQGLLDQAGIALGALDALAFGRGPGSFTGVRIAAAVIQGAAFGAGLPVVPVSTLAALAQGQFRRGGQQRLLSALDARMNEVYWGGFTIGPDALATPCGAELVCPPGQAPLPFALQGSLTLNGNSAVISGGTPIDFSQSAQPGQALPEFPLALPTTSDPANVLLNLTLADIGIGFQGTANTYATGTLVPTPGALCVLGLAGALAARRRR